MENKTSENVRRSFGECDVRDEERFCRKSYKQGSVW
jgi:hypothetical protein